MSWSAAATIGASVIGGVFGSNSAKKANKAAAEEARLNREFQRETLQNQHQWQVADLRAAGLNPRLSASLGGAGSASGSMAPVMDTGKPAVEAANSAISALRTREEIKNLKETNNQIRSQTELNKAGAVASLANAQSTNVNSAIKARMLPLAEGIHTVSNKVLSSAKSVASEYREKGFKQMFMDQKPATGGGLRPAAGWLMDRLGF